MLTQIIIRGAYTAIEYECSCCHHRMTNRPSSGKCDKCGKG